MFEVEIKCGCYNCKEYFDQSEITGRCNTCEEDAFNEQIKEAINRCIEHSYLWTDKDGYCGFETEKDLENYLIGVRRGFMDALFWICDYFGEVDFFEELNFIQPEWIKKK